MNSKPYPSSSGGRAFRATVIRRLPTLLPVVAAIALLVAFGGYAQDREPAQLNIVLDIDALYEPIASLPIHGETAAELVTELQEKHYAEVRIDDDFSSLVFDNYLDLLDASHLYFLKEDIDQLSIFRYRLDDALLAGSVEPGFEIYNVFYRRVLERLIYAINQVEHGIPAMDFTRDESFDTGREDAPYPASLAESDELWRLRVKNSVLNLRLTGDSDEEIKEKLSRRYRNQLSQMLKTDERDIFQSYLNTVAVTVEPHTSYFSPRDSENFNMDLSLSLTGIGASLTLEDEYTKIVELIAGGPAERGGELQVGDRVIGIGQGAEGEIQDVVGMRLDDVVDQIRGDIGTVVRLQVIPAGAVSESNSTVINITRDLVKLEDQAARKEIIEFRHNGQDYRMGVIDLPTFYLDFDAVSRGEQDFKSSTMDVKVLLEELKEEGVDGVVIDLRDNGGGSMAEAINLTGLFIETGAAVQVRYSSSGDGMVRPFGDTDPTVTWTGPLAVLVNRTSASSSEIFAGAIQDYQRGLVLGNQTFGKGTVQELVPMDFGQAKLTRSKFYRISGDSTQHRGVMPDIVLPDIYAAYDDIGESSLDGALPWDTVRPLDYPRFLPIPQLLPELRARHGQRAETDPDLLYLRERIERTRRLRGKEEFSLNEAAVKAEREANRRAEFEADNMRRLLKGLPPREWVDDDTLLANADDEASEDSPGEQEAQAEVEDAHPPLTETDAMLLAGNDDMGASAGENNANANEEGREGGEEGEGNEADEASTDAADEEPDALLLESGRILADFIQLTARELSQNSTPLGSRRPNQASQD